VIMNKLKVMAKRDILVMVLILIVLFKQIMLLPAIVMGTGSDDRQKNFSPDLELDSIYCI
jgi:hypothetical protein